MMEAKDTPPVRKYRPTGIKISPTEDRNAYMREYYKIRGRFRNKEKEEPR